MFVVRRESENNLSFPDILEMKYKDLLPGHPMTSKSLAEDVKFLYFSIYYIILYGLRHSIDYLDAQILLSKHFWECQAALKMMMPSEDEIIFFGPLI